MKHQHFEDVARLLREAKTDCEAKCGPGADPEWPLHYAELLAAPLSERLNQQLTKSELVYCLIKADNEHQARASDTDWAEFYADTLIEHCGAFEDTPQDTLALYHFVGCPFCAMVTSAIQQLGVEVELRDIMLSDQHRSDLMAARGRATVPVLRISSPDHDDVWMPESRDIVHYLQEHYGS